MGESFCKDTCSEPEYTCTEDGCCRDESPSPIVIDVEANGYALTSAVDGVDFDISAIGGAVRVSWTAPGADDSWLALDRNRNGFIDDGSELFGTATPQPENDEPNGFEALKIFDQAENGGNDDNWISAGDSIFHSLLLWRDVNHNGISEAGELSPLFQSVVTAIALNYQEHKWADIHGNQFRYRAKTKRSGHPGGPDKWAYDVILVTAP